ncbi:MAG: hypothetical protein GXO61_05600 [Epsilonproteobacteria bacterium]|nr:hypothetical protein [Campylobacterota bacterium]
MRKLVLSLLFSFSLFAGDPWYIASILKTKVGETLKNPIMFVRYGSGVFDWLALTTDGNFVAKLEGLNPDGTFNYTILGDPRQYGLRFEVSLTGVRILSASAVSTQEAVANTAVRATVDNALKLVTGFVKPTRKKVRSLQQLPLELIRKVNPSYTRYITNEPCPQGGSVVTNYIDSNHMVIEYHSCVDASGITTNGKISLEILTLNNAIAKYENLEIRSPNEVITLPSATVNLTYVQDDYTQELRVKSVDFRIDYLKSQNFQRNSFLELQNYIIQSTYEDEVVTTFSGLARSECSSEWVNMSTLSPVKQDFYETCPYEGKVNGYSSQANIDLLFNYDFSIDAVEHNTQNLIKHFTNCLTIQSEAVCR